MVSSHWLVLMGIWFLMIEPGLVVVRPRLENLGLCLAKSLSMVEAEIFMSFVLISSSRINLSKNGNQRGMLSLSLVEQRSSVFAR